MAVGRAGGRRGGGGGAGRVGGSGGAGGAAKSSGASYGKVDKTLGTGAATVAGPAAAGGASGPSPVLAAAVKIAAELRAGQLKSREEATKKLVSEILRHKIRVLSRSVGQLVTQAVEQDQRLTEALNRVWSRAEGESQEVTKRPKK